MAARPRAFAALVDTLETAAKTGVVPGGVVLCATDGQTRFHQAFGARQLQPERHAADERTIYDIASVTKAVGTSVLVMKAVGDGLVDLEHSVDRYLPEFLGAGKAAVTVRQLLCHAAGLPAHRPFYETCAAALAAGPAAGRQAIARAAAAEPLINAPGTVAVYSDLGFILLGWLLERVTGCALDSLFRDTVCKPLRLGSTTFVNLEDPHAPAALRAHAPVAPTQFCSTRGSWLVGEVDDLNARAMAGVAGHSGLFSDADDVATIAAALVAVWHGQPNRYAGAAASTTVGATPTPALAIPRAVIEEFWRPAGTPLSTWRLGWDGPAPHNSQAGERISREAVGHLGFTGCSLWIDPARALWIVLFTNRVHPAAVSDPRFAAFRAAVHDAALDAMIG